MQKLKEFFNRLDGDIYFNAEIVYPRLAGCQSDVELDRVAHGWQVGGLGTQKENRGYGCGLAAVVFSKCKGFAVETDKRPLPDSRSRNHVAADASQDGDSILGTLDARTADD